MKLDRLVLTNGIEVKLRRNALSVIEAPTGNEDDDFELENGQSNGSDMASDDTKKVHRSRLRLRKSTTGSPRNKTVGRSLHHDSQSKASFTTSRGSVKIDLRKLEMAALRRYLLHFNLKRLMFSCTCHKREESIIREKYMIITPKDDKDKQFCA
ncbi:uncharacterized protein LOC110928935 isoform X1 [Helianthus annuus]|uniref:uncharacterized protein LOC110928935 isoform X1 n=1 Tax=Helianthus annuus TaxID=4232 RepID=UPI000B9011B2|nr:uncharacterized protein LOC110928935 isoform X1 [Helianthus annuus]XP_035844416.1 uncharacterized protein LOC110928935 isoform X1 [Helianthus annuus]XP_035844417.1 uncharacterized protein LOC110928935 isoform X1 [Helianthus annuus]XP_035844418.1 uncharacterized protein LOC110928935 isoform X1 [Helianthus annuus]XP_035844419.1 uncharacterized protein LOC110928935 isoform X1 [Helianthus annuus]XP_035844420.1 uncharacterized protein LOC110928935 isoform X1 [Helianthus annuus]XP_035844421.1 un